MSKASLAQGKQLLELFSGATSEQLQMLVENGDVVKLLLAAPLEKVDRYLLVNALQHPALSIEEAADGGVSVGEWVYVWTKMRVRVVYPQEGRSQAYVMVETSSQSHGLTLREGSRIVRITEVEADG